MSGTVTNPSTVYSGQTSSTTGAYPGATGQYTQNAYLNGLNTFANTPYQPYTGEMTAGINPVQNTAAYDQLGLSQYQPQAVSPGNITQYAGGNGAGGLSMNGMNLGGYMSPYTSGVINTSMDQLNRQLAQTNMASDGQAALSGAFGGDRAQIVDTENARNTNQIAAQTIAGLNQANYTNAQGLATGDLNRQLQAGTQQAGLDLQAGQGNQFADLQGANLRNTANNSAFQMGTAFQNTNQTADTNAYGQYLRAFQYPFQQAQGSAGLTSSYAPSLQYQGTQTGNSSGINTPPAPSTLSQITGGVTAAAGLGGLLFGNGGSGSGSSGSGAAGGLLGAAGSAASGIGNFFSAPTSGGISGLDALLNGTSSSFTNGIYNGAGSIAASGLSDAANAIYSVFAGGGRVGGLLGYAQGGRIGYDDGGTVDDPHAGTYVAVDNSQAPNIDAQAVADGIVPGAVQDAPDGPAVPIAAASVDQKGLAAQAAMAKPRRERSANPSAPIPTHEDSSHGSVQPPDISTAPAVSVPGDNDLISRAPLKAMGPQGLMGAAMAPQPQGLQGPGAPTSGAAPGGQSPDMIDSMYARGGNSWAMPVLAAGLGMMASKSPYFAQGVGEGGLAGMQEAQNVSQMRMAQAAQAQKLAIGQQQLRGATTQNDANLYRLKMLGMVPSDGAPGGDPSMSGGLAGAAGASGGPGATPGSAPSGAPQLIAPKNSGYSMSPQWLMQMGQSAEISKPGSGAPYFKLAQGIAQKGYTFDGNGNVALAPGFLQAQAANLSNAEFAKLPAQVQKAAAEAQIRTHEALVTTAGTEQIKAPYAPPIKTEAVGDDGVLHEQQTPLPQWAAQNGGPQVPGSPVVGDPKFQNAVKAAAAVYGVDPTWAAGIQAAESGGSQNAMTATSSAGARGGMQMMPSTAGGMGVNPNNGPQNAAGGVAYLSQLQAKYNGNQALATAAYNAGPGRVDAYLKNGTPLPAQTVSYVGKVLGGNGQQLLQSATNGNPAPTSAPSAPSGTIQGRPIMNPEQTAISEAYGKQAADTMQQGVKADDSLTRIKVLDQADQYFTPGSSGEMRMQGMKIFADGLRQIGITPPASFLNGSAAAETIQKEGGYLAAEMTRSLGSREAAAVFNQVRNIQPGITLSEGGYQVIKNSIAMGLQRQKDMAQYQSYWLQPQSQGGLGKTSVSGMVDSFNQQRPLDVYASRVIPYEMPKTQDNLVPNAVYRTARGPAIWNGSAFQAVQ